MNTTDLVHYVSTGVRPRPTAARLARAVPYHELATPARMGILRARQFLSSHVRADFIRGSRLFASPYEWFDDGQDARSR